MTRPGVAAPPRYPAEVSTELTPTPESGPRPPRLTVAALLSALEGVALLAGGLYVLVRGFGAEDRTQAVTGGITLLALAAIPLIAARGLWLRRRWSRGPAMITQIMALPVAYSLLQADSVLIPGGIALAAAAITSLVCLVNRSTTEALGIRTPSDPA